MFQASTFRPMTGQGFLPQVHLAGVRPAAAPQASSPVMGYTLEEGKKFYEDAKAAVAKFDNLATQISKIVYKPTRDQLVSDYGLLEPGNKDKALYMRGTLDEYVKQVEASVPLNYYVFIQDTTRPRNRLSWLTNNDVGMETAVTNAVALYGLTPEPQVIIKEVSGAGGTDLTVPILIGAGAVVLALVFG